MPIINVYSPADLFPVGSDRELAERLTHLQSRNVRVGSSSRSPATLSHYFLRLPTICCEFARAIIAPRHPVFASGGVAFV